MMEAEATDWARQPIQKHQEHVRYSADQYDAYTANCVGQFDEELANQVIQEASSRLSGATLLDIGTGTARFLVYLAAMKPLAGLRLVGTDLFPDMIERAVRTLEETGLGGAIELFQDDIHESRLAEGFADIIISRSTIHHWRNPARALSEIFRLLKPRGIALIHDVRRDATPEAVTEFNKLRATAGIGPSMLEEKFTVDEVKGFLAEAGLVEVTRIYAPKKGLMGLGMAIHIHKP